MIRVREHEGADVTTSIVAHRSAADAHVTAIARADAIESSQRQEET